VKVALNVDVLRKSTMLRMFRTTKAPGWERAVEEVEKIHARFPDCPVHGKLEDPIVGTGGPKTGFEHIAIICPWCSSDELREAWEKEAPLS
jgi:hypothetical protein